MFHGVNMCFKKFYFEQCILKINIKIDSFNYFLNLKKTEFIHSRFTIFNFTIWQNPTFKFITNA